MAAELATDAKEAIVNVNKYVKAIHVELEKVIKGTDQAQKSIFVNQDLVKQASEEFIIVEETARGLDQQAADLVTKLGE